MISILEKKTQLEKTYILGNVTSAQMDRGLGVKNDIAKLQ